MLESRTIGVDEGAEGRPVAALWDILLVFAPLLLFAFAGNQIGAETMGGGLLINLGFVVSAVVGSFVLRRRGSGWREIGLSPPQSWRRTAALAVGALVGALVVQNLAGWLLVALPGNLTPPDVSRFNPLAGNLPFFLLMLVLAWTTIAFGEEMIYRAFLIDRLGALFGAARWPVALAVLGSSVVFGLAHFAEGPAGIVTNGAFGLLFASIYVKSGRNLWITIIAHGLLNTLRFVVLFMGVV